MKRVVPQQNVMGVRDLFAYGPWPFILVFWIAAAILAAVWMTVPISRIAAVTSPELCAVSFAALGGMAASIARARFMRRRGAGMLLVVASMAIGAAAGAAAARTIFQPLLARGCDCAPLLAAQESSTGALASRLLPLLALLVWCRWVFAGLTKPDHLDAARINDYSRFLTRSLPLRVIATVLVAGGAIAFLLTRVAVPETLPARETMARMRGASASSILVATSPAHVQKIEQLRRARAADAKERLASLDLDGARPLVREAACTLVLPRTKPEPDIAAAEEAFEKLDREIEYAFATWRPSATSGATLLELLPMEAEGDAVRLPLMWGDTVNDSTMTITTGRVEGRYKKRFVMDALIVTAVGRAGSFNAGVAMKLLGTSGIDARLPEIISRRLGRAPSGGVVSTAAGAMCAMWNFGDLKIRLGPAVRRGEPPPAPSEPVWLTYYRSSVTDRYRASRLLPRELEATYDCGALDSQSH